jgi:hypothetical protein
MNEYRESNFFNLPVRILLLAVCTYIFLGLAGEQNSKHETVSGRNNISIYQDLSLSSAEIVNPSATYVRHDLSTPGTKVKFFIFNHKLYQLNTLRNTIQRILVQDNACMSFITFSGYFLLPGFIPDTGKDLPDLA